MWQFIQHSKPKIQKSKSHAEGISLAVTNTFTLTLSAAIVIAMTPDSIPEISCTG
jgi:NOL1/NOP2/fmu family ribosome biogenesis protein